jgi:hypothetical protein
MPINQEGRRSAYPGHFEGEIAVGGASMRLATKKFQVWVNTPSWELIVSDYLHEIRESGRFRAEGRWSVARGSTVSAVVDYGDGSGEQDLIFKPDLSFRLEHQYHAVGRYTPRLTIRDAAGHSATGFLTCNVIRHSASGTVPLARRP